MIERTSVRAKKSKQARDVCTTQHVEAFLNQIELTPFRNQIQKKGDLNYTICFPYVQDSKMISLRFNIAHAISSGLKLQGLKFHAPY